MGFPKGRICLTACQANSFGKHCENWFKLVFRDRKYIIQSVTSTLIKTGTNQDSFMLWETCNHINAIITKKQVHEALKVTGTGIGNKTPRKTYRKTQSATANLSTEVSLKLIADVLDFFTYRSYCAELEQIADEIDQINLNPSIQKQHRWHKVMRV